MKPEDDEPRMIQYLRWLETSGVDHPANETEGWVVMKQKKERRMAKMTPLQEEFENFLAGLKSAMSSTQYKALMRVLRILVVGETDLNDPAGAGPKTRFAPTVEALEKLCEDMKSLELSDEVIITVLRFLGGNPMHPVFGDSKPGPVDAETAKAISDVGLGEVVVKVLGAAFRKHGTPLVTGVDALVHKGLSEAEED